jgi:pimeloyl-ACP methyl ester carboxylesterase
MTEGFIDIFKTNIYYKFLHKKLLATNSPILVFLHEGLGSTAMWKDFPEELCRITGLPGLLYDREGYGLSQPLTEPLGEKFIEFQGEIFFPELIKRLNINNPIILFGHSDGGSIAFVAAASMPEQVIALITEAPHVFIEQQSVDGLIAARDGWQNPKFRQNLEKYHGSKAETIFKAWIENWLHPNAFHWNIYSYLEKIKSPLLYIQGNNDHFGTEKQWIETKRRIQAKSESLFIDDCGHIPHLQARPQVIEAVKQFIAAF